MKVLPIEVYDRVAIVGKSGAGKSTCGKELAAAAMKAGWRVVAFDPEDEWSKHGRANEAVDLGPLKDRCTADELRMDPKRWLEDDHLSLAVIPSEDLDERVEECMELVDYVRAFGDIFVIWGEVGSYSRNPEGGSTKAIGKLTDIACRGRHWGCPTLFEAQRMIHIPIDARAQLTQVECFLQNLPADIKALEDLTIITDRTFAERVQRLRLGESEIWRDTLRKEGSK